MKEIGYIFFSYKAQRVSLQRIMYKGGCLGKVAHPNASITFMQLHINVDSNKFKVSSRGSTA